MDRNLTHYTGPIGSPIWMNMNLGLLAFFILIFIDRNTVQTQLDVDVI
jgi:hypothetical protein